MPEVPCATCGKEFHLASYLIGKIKFCSKECRYKSVYPIPGHKKCYRCGEIKLLESFSLLRKSKSGHQNACKKCVADYQREWRRNNKDKANSRTRCDRKNRPFEFWSLGIVHNHKDRGFEVKFTAKELRDYIRNNDLTKCNICGAVVVWGHRSGKMISNSPTIDRVGNGKTLTLENIQLLCRDCNATKGARSMKDFVSYCKRVVDKFGPKAEETRSPSMD